MNPHEPITVSSPRPHIVVLAFAAVFPFAAAWFYVVVLASRQLAVVQTAYGAAKILQFALPAVWLCLFRRQRLRLPMRNTGVRVGILFGIAVVSSMLIVYYFWLKPAQYLAPFASLISTKARSFGMGTPLRFIAGAAVLSLLHSLLEEYWRWFIFGGLRRYMPVAAAIVVSSIAFAAHHVVLLASFFGGLNLPTVLFSLCVAIGGAVWAWLYHRSGSLLGPWLSHALIDAGIFVVGFDMLFR